MTDFLPKLSIKKATETTQFVRVSDDENEKAIEIPTEEDGGDEDGTLLLTSLVAQFPGACGLKYRSESGGLRGVRLANGSLHPPNGFWGITTYIVNFPKDDSKRKVEVDDDVPVSTKMKRFESRKCSDLVVLGLPWKSTEDDMQEYFKQFGDLIKLEIKRDPRSGQCRGFGFIQFKEFESQILCLAARHEIDGRWCKVKLANSHVKRYPRSGQPKGFGFNRFKEYKPQIGCLAAGHKTDKPWCEVKLPNSQTGRGSVPTNGKIFVAGSDCTAYLTKADLREYFEQFGEVIEVFFPKPFRPFAFVTFADPVVADGLCGEYHVINAASVHISRAEPKGQGEDGGNQDDVRGRSYGRGNSNKSYGRGDRDDSGWGNSNSYKQMNPADMSSGDSNSNNFGMNMLGSAMLGTAQAVMQGNAGQQGYTDSYQLGPGFGGTRDSRSTSAYSSSASGWGGDGTQGQSSYLAWGSRAGNFGG